MYRLLALFVVSLFVAGCPMDPEAKATEVAEFTATALAAGAATPEATSTPIPESTATPTPRPSATPLPTVTPRPGAEDAPQGTETGDPQIDAIVSAIEGQDAVALASLFVLTDTTCTTVQGLGGPPKCWDFPDLPPDGSQVSAFPAAQCEGFWVTDIAELVQRLVDQEPKLYAVLRLDPPQPVYALEEGYPTLDHMILLESPAGPGGRQGILMGVADGRVRWLSYVCVGPPEEVLDRWSYEIVLRGPAYQ